MKLKYIVPDMAQTFGNLEFAGEMTWSNSVSMVASFP